MKLVRMLFTLALTCIITTAVTSWAQDDHLAIGSGASETRNITASGGSINETRWIGLGENGGQGNVNISGGTMTTTGTRDMTDLRTGFLIGTVVENGTITISGSGNFTTPGFVFDAKAGDSASLIMRGGTVTSTSYPAFGAYQGKTGRFVMSDGTFTTSKSFYAGLDGIGYVDLSGGLLDINNGLQIARDFNGKGTSEGYFNMTGGTLDVQSYIICAYKGKSGGVYGTDHVTLGTFNVSGDSEVICGSNFTLATNANSQDYRLIRGISNFSGNAKMTVGSMFNIGNGETSTSIVNQGGMGTMNLYDNAAIEAKGFVGIGSHSDLNLYGGTFSATSDSAVLANAGTVNLAGGTLSTKKGIVNTGIFRLAGGTLAAADGVPCLSVSADGQIIASEGTSNIEGYVETGNYFAINPVAGSTATGTPGNVTVNGSGKLYINGKFSMADTANAGRKADISLGLGEGAILVTDSGYLETAGGLDVSSKNGSSTMTVSKNGYAKCAGYFWVGKEKGTTGTLLVTDNATLEVVKSFYSGYEGAGTTEIRQNGTITCSNNLQIGRDYNAQGGTAGSVLMYDNATLKSTAAGGILIVGYHNGGEKASYGLLEMHGTSTTSANSLEVAYNDGSKGTIHLYDSSSLQINTNAKIGSGAASVNVYDRATASFGGTATVYSAASLNLYGGETTIAAVDNSGTVQMAGGTLNVSGNMTNNAKLNFVSGVKGAGTLAVNGTLTNNGTINVGFDGVGLAKYDTANGVTLMTTGGTAGAGTVVDTNAALTTSAFDGNNLVMKFKYAADGTMDAQIDRLGLDAPSAAGWVNLTNFTGADPFVFTLVMDGIDTEAAQTAFVNQLNADLALGDETPVRAQAGKDYDTVLLTGLTSDLLDANVFAWDFTDALYDNAALSALGTNQVPEPAAWLLLTLGGLLLAWRKRVTLFNF